MEREAVDLGPVLGFMQVLWEVEQGLNKRSQAMLREHGVTGPQRLVIRVVARQGPISLADLARVLRLHPASVTRLASTLESKQMVLRRPDPDDKRQILLELGPAGAAVARASKGTVEQAIARTLEQSTRREVEATIAVLRRAVHNLAL